MPQGRPGEGPSYITLAMGRRWPPSSGTWGWKLYLHVCILVSSFLLVETLSRSGRDRLSIVLNIVLVGVLVTFCWCDKKTPWRRRPLIESVALVLLLQRLRVHRSRTNGGSDSWESSSPSFREFHYLGSLYLTNLPEMSGKSWFSIAQNFGATNPAFKGAKVP